MSHNYQVLLAPWVKNGAAESALTELVVIVNNDNRGISEFGAAEDTPQTRTGSDVDRGVADVNTTRWLL